MSLSPFEKFFDSLTQSDLFDLVDLVVGKPVGQGAFRTVRHWGNDEAGEHVVKYEHGRGKFHNVQEWLVWQEVKDHKALARWFAPCLMISDNGHWLIQRRTTAVTLAELERYLPKIPAFFTDLKTGNWGWLGGKIVCHDYGMINFDHPLDASRLRRADWWE